ncbi:glycosyltransferase family 4 protein [Gramella lutea]|uniref:Glycosyltransferase family 4 protein n=1 Tax=Christiangramia lutea TaxID=1607951 RepID=A0A9X1V0G5_9FLAO|nr:glycosyltransferase family 4 protein [Christiangramia lutea]MCH4821570.1 glycosyltransferase family 4 protein [Christiangramia lutea]
MHIAFLTPEYPHERSTPSGGLGTSIRNLAETLVEKDEKVSVLIFGQEIDRNFSENGIQFYLIKQRKYPFGGWYFYRKHLEKIINELTEEKQIDILETPDWTGITAFMKFCIPHVIRLNGSDGYFCELEERQQKYKNRLFEKNALKNADSILSVSDFTGKKTMQLFDLERSYKVIPNSIKVENFRPSTKKPETGRILYFGSLIQKKGVLELAEIFNNLIQEKPDAQLILAGRDVIDIFEKISTLELLKRKLSEEALKRTEYVGSLDYSMVRKEIEKASVIVLPSFAEALPMTWIEAMAMEKALVTSNIGWAPEVMLDQKTGYMVDPRNHKLYASRILELLEDAELSEEMGRAAREQVLKKFASRLVAEKNIQFYQELIEKKKN